MRTFTAETADPAAICEELMNGPGAVRITGLFSPDQIADARAIIMQHSDNEGDKVTHFQGAAMEDGKANLQRRVWNLLAKGPVFSEMAAHPVLMQILGRWLGNEFIMGSIAANRILPGGPGQEPHIDFPYWDFHKPDSHPMGLNSSFPMNAQVTVALDHFTDQSGATAYLPGSQKNMRYPTPDDHEGFYANCARMTGEPGDVVIFYGAAWHCAMPNNADHDRNAVLINYIPKFVKPLEDMPGALPQSFLDAASPDMRQLLGFNYKYPEILDQADAENAEGMVNTGAKA
ncbi:phytanoyl-CoA dioxygenase family protein [uncultured Tateyamaria sp.]|uniref:phytanoyl-CoA dioxygenase family protein n=1 Tax=uncultured Tateyamaria sp. TaxID=455651 RepID=UPI00262DBADA|nr:phytanoyl-CoA dioxygenase family protein [uncultured Tateyamaria sp.]